MQNTMFACDILGKIKVSQVASTTTTTTTAASSCSTTKVATVTFIEHIRAISHVVECLVLYDIHHDHQTHVVTSFYEFLQILRIATSTEEKSKNA